MGNPTMYLIDMRGACDESYQALFRNEENARKRIEDILDEHRHLGGRIHQIGNNDWLVYDASLTDEVIKEEDNWTWVITLNQIEVED